MSSQCGHSHTGGRVCIPSLTLETAHELSWRLGERITQEDDRATLVGKWQTTDSRQSLALFEVTPETAVLRYQSPVGREHYLGTTLSELERARADLDAASTWHRVEK